MFILKKWILQIIGKKISSEIGLKEGVVNKKQWWKSKTLWSIVLNAAVGIIQIVNPDLMNSQVAITLVTILTAMGIYGRATAESKLTK